MLAQLSGWMNGSSFPAQTVGADRIRPPFSQRGNEKTHTHGTALSVEWGGEFCALYQYNLPYHCGGSAADGRILSAPTGRMRSTGYLRKSGVAGGFYPPLQSMREAGAIQRTALSHQGAGRHTRQPTERTQKRRGRYGHAGGRKYLVSWKRQEFPAPRCLRG